MLLHEAENKIIFLYLLLNSTCPPISEELAIFLFHYPLNLYFEVKLSVTNSSTSKGSLLQLAWQDHLKYCQ